MTCCFERLVPAMLPRSSAVSRRPLLLTTDINSIVLGTCLYSRVLSFSSFCPHGSLLLKEGAFQSRTSIVLLASRRGCQLTLMFFLSGVNVFFLSPWRNKFTLEVFATPGCLVRDFASVTPLGSLSGSYHSSASCPRHELNEVESVFPGPVSCFWDASWGLGLRLQREGEKAQLSGRNLFPPGRLKGTWLGTVHGERLRLSGP